MGGGQLGLLLWKNYVVRKRRPVILGLVFLWPVVIFMLLYAVRDNVDPEYNPTCQFPGRLMPHDGLLPFVQSYICSISNPCDPLDKYEEIPTYKNAALSPLIMEIQPILRNDTVLNAVKTLPQSVKFMKSMAEILTKPDIKKIFDRGIKLGDLFNNHELVKQSLKEQMPGVRDNLVDDLFDASIKLYYLIESFGSSNIDGIVCSPESLKLFLVVPKEENLFMISKTLCNLDSNKIPEILERLAKHLDFAGLLEMVSRVMAKFHDYDFITDVTNAINTILDLDTLENYIPKYLKLKEWIPKVFILFKNVNFKTIDLSFINKSIEIMDPIFMDDYDWPVARHGLDKFNSLLQLIKDILERNETINNNNLEKNVFDLSKDLSENSKMLLYSSVYSEDLTKVLDRSYLLLQDGVKLTNILINRHKDSIKLTTEVLDGLRNLFPTKIMNTLTYLISMIENIVRMVHHVAIIHEEAMERIFNITKKYESLVKKILTNVNPEVYESMIKSFSQLDIVENLIETLKKKKNPSDVICDDTNFNKIFLKNINNNKFTNELYNIICKDDDNGKLFINDIYNVFEFTQFREIVDNTLSTFVNMALSRPVPIEKTNLTSSIGAIRKFLYYLEDLTVRKINWNEQFSDVLTKQWINIFNNTQFERRCIILGFHLSIAKVIGSRSLSYITIKPDLENMDIIADLILQDLRLNPTDWINQVRKNELELLESFYLTVNDRMKVLKFLEYSNFTRSYCLERNPPDLLNYPKGSNITLLKGLVCRLSKAVQTELEINLTMSELQEMTFKDRKPFNWTGFNEKVIEIYTYIDILVQFDRDNYYIKHFNQLQNNFTNVWLNDILIEHSLEISVGLLCRFFTLAESPLFNVQSKPGWKNLYAFAWAVSPISDTIEQIIDDIVNDNNTVKLPQVMKDMPQTEILLDSILRNLPAISRDIVDLLTRKSPINYISVIVNYNKNEIHWPCVYQNSIGEALQFRPGTKVLVREIERISCNPGLFIKEWMENPILLRLQKVFINNKTTDPIQVFNWTSGYIKFRNIIQKFQLLLNTTTDLILNNDNPNDNQLIIHSNNNSLLSDALNVVVDAIPKFEEDGKNILDYFDSEIDKNIKVFQSNLTAKYVWMNIGQSRKGIDEILVMIKFGTRVLHDILNVVFEIFNNNINADDNINNVNLLKLLGFTDNSPLFIIYKRFPYILATIINGITDFSLDNKIYNDYKNHSKITCTIIFNWFNDYKIHLTNDEYRVLKNFTCDYDPENFNAFIDLYLKETNVWRIPVSHYKVSFFKLIQQIYNLNNLINNKIINIELPIDNKYFKNSMNIMKQVLEDSQGLNEDNFTLEWSIYRLIIQGISEVLNNAAFALQDRQSNLNVLYLWDFVKTGEASEFIKYLENYPEQTIAFFVTITNFNLTLTTFDKLHREICINHFNSTYWFKQENKHFLIGLCAWDQFNLLKSLTSENLANLIIGKQMNTTNNKIQLLSNSVTKFLDVWLKLKDENKDKIYFTSKILNISTWKNLHNDTISLIHNTERSWIHKLISEVDPTEHVFTFESSSIVDYNTINHYFEDHPANILRQIFQVTEFWLDIISDGDIWQKLRQTFEQSKVKIILNLIEDSPNLIITLLDTFLNSQRLNDYEEKFLSSEVNICDIDKYLIPPNYIRKKGILSSITNFCQKILMNNDINISDFKPLLPIKNLTLENNIININMNNNSKQKVKILASLNESYIMEQLEKFQSTLIRVLNEGFKTLKMPSWYNSFQESTLNDFKKQFDHKELRPLSHSIVTKSINTIKNIFNSTSEYNCSWCNTRIIEIINSQLNHYQIYSYILCHYDKLNVTEIENIIDNELYWKKTIGMIKNFDYLNKKEDTISFINAIKDTLYYIIDIIMDYKDPQSDKNLDKCLMKAVDGIKQFSPSVYSKIIAGIINNLQKNVKILDIPSNHKDILNRTQLSEKFVPIWMPLKDIVKKSSIEQVEKLLPNASLNVNLLLADGKDSVCPNYNDCKNSTILNSFLRSKRSDKLLKYNRKLSNYLETIEIANILTKNLDFELINNEIINWRNNASYSLIWLQEILQHLLIIVEEGGSLLDIASKIDFQDVSNVLGVPDIADGVVNLLKDKTIDKLFTGLKEILQDIQPFLDNEQIKHDLFLIVNTFESMEIFKNLGLLDMKYIVSEMFLDWNSLRKFLIDNIGIESNIVTILSESKIDMLSVFMKEGSAISLKDTICSDDKLNDILNFDDTKTTVDEIKNILCQLNSSSTQKITITLIQNINFDYVFKNLMSANVKNILKNANLSDTDGQIIFNNFQIISELIPSFKDKLTTGFLKSKNDDDEKQKINKDEIKSNDISNFLADSSEILCGRQLISNNNGQFFRIISSIKDREKKAEEIELNSLSTKFCKETYNAVANMQGGKIIWSYVKPLLRGKILYTPNTNIIKNVMNLANKTFNEIDVFGELMTSIERTLVSLANLTDMGDSLNDLKDIMASKVMKLAIKSMSNGKLSGDLTNFDLGEIAWRLKQSGKMIDMIKMLNNFIECVLIDRMSGYESEEALEREARKLMETNEFLAGIVFLNTNNRSKRALIEDLPNDVSYKIRMDVDYVPSTKRLKNQFWIPGPEDSFIENLRYLRGFIQLQDSIDRAIIEIKSGVTTQNWKTLTQQMPYPCWKFAPFQSTLYESQGLITCFFFALMMCVGSAVRYIVWERESHNAMVMSVMGLKPWRNTFAWFITSTVELTVVMISICIILIIGKILPHSDPLAVLLLMMDYVLSIVAFCYMISTMFHSASLAAVTAVVFFLLTYMPYVIVIAMEANLSLGYNILMCFSMSTSFCYGCLLIARREVQGVGLTWESIWEESKPGDQISFGLILLMIAIDGIIYTIIGYLVTKYSNSEEDSDMSSMTVNEKQIGVRFEAVRKVFHTEQGECVAVDDFTLKLCEGEVTSLLGRNGAGKTTIIKMLTGMLAPTCGEIHLNGEEGTKPDIGVCPQENVLIDTLTPREHMIFYAKLKRPDNNEEMQKSVNIMLSSLELGKQEHEPVSRLSGGTKRRLCVALAFLGSPKLVILDEPGAGVDPAARRRIWRLIDQHRVNRTVLLSTHHLDEADMLSDTVVIMHRGKILCAGSPLALKTTYGQGYWMNIAFSNDETKDYIDRNKLDELKSSIEKVIVNASMEELSGSEVVVNLPFLSKHGESNDIAGVIKSCEDNHKSIGFTRISLDCDSLEKVFLDLCNKVDSGKSIGSTLLLASSSSSTSSSRVSVRESMTSVDSINTVGVNIIDDTETIIGNSIPNPSAIKQMKALLKKRMWHFMKDWRSPLATLILPTLFVAVAMGFSLIRPPSSDEPPLDLNPKLYNIHPTYFYSIDDSTDSFLQQISLELHDKFGDDYAGAWQIHPNDTGTCKCLEGQHICQGVSKAVEGLFQTLPGRPTLDWVISTFQEYIEKRYGGWSLSHWKEDPLFVIWFNNKGHHALPAYLNALNEAILRASGVPGHLKTFNHPLKLSSEQLNRTTLLQHVADVGVALVLLIAFNLVAAQGAKELVRERLSEEKRILYLAGVHPVTYWTIALLWDFFVFLMSIALAVVVFEIFGLPAYVARDNLPGVCLLLILFAWASIPFTHLMEKTFDDSSLSNMVLFCLNTFIGVICLGTILVIDILGKSQAVKDTRELLHNLMLFFPQYTLGDALVRMSTNDITAELLERFHMDTYKSPLGWELIGPHYVYLFIIGVTLYLMNLAIECRIFANCQRKRVSYEEVIEDEDVVRERIRVENSVDTDVLKTVKLRKEYQSVYGKNVAVQNLSIGIKSGECFGLLGVNGAGKSSTFKMLTAETIPTAGRILLKGKTIGIKPLCNGEIGYCPQSDSLDGYLSPHQCLTIHGEVCGLENVNKIVESILNKFDLFKYAHQRVSSLSGGNKRKLCAAISVMAPVSLVLMDEPTSGMDPASKKLVARAVHQVTRAQGSVIMTSHSVTECEKLCNRVGILAKAGLRCIGTANHLKHKFGEGYIAFLRFSQPVTLKELKDAISRHLSRAQICSRQTTATRLLLPRVDDVALSETFSRVKRLAEDLKATDYTLTQSSLDQVLVNFSEELEEVQETPKYRNMDTIHMDTF